MHDYPRHIVTVSALVTNANHEVLLIRSPRRGWEFPGGQVEERETLTAALVREIQEETGILAAVGNLVGVYSSIGGASMVHFGFLASWVSGALATSPESVETEWVHQDQALARVTHEAIKHRLRDMLDFDGEIIYRVYKSNPYEIVQETRLSGSCNDHPAQWSTY